MLPHPRPMKPPTKPPSPPSYPPAPPSYPPFATGVEVSGFLCCRFRGLPLSAAEWSAWQRMLAEVFDVWDWRLRPAASIVPILPMYTHFPPAVFSALGGVRPECDANVLVLQMPGWPHLRDAADGRLNWSLTKRCGYEGSTCLNAEHVPCIAYVDERTVEMLDVAAVMANRTLESVMMIDSSMPCNQMITPRFTALLHLYNALPALLVVMSGAMWLACALRHRRRGMQRELHHVLLLTAQARIATDPLEAVITRAARRVGASARCAFVMVLPSAVVSVLAHAVLPQLWQLTDHSTAAAIGIGALRRIRVRPRQPHRPSPATVHGITAHQPSQPAAPPAGPPRLTAGERPADGWCAGAAGRVACSWHALPRWWSRTSRRLFPRLV